jgi:hypothetical protein
MSDRYGITQDGYEFKVSQIAGVTVGRYKTEQEAQQNIEACEQGDLILKTARGLVKKAVDALIRTHHFDRSTARPLDRAKLNSRRGGLEATPGAIHDKNA